MARRYDEENSEQQEPDQAQDVAEDALNADLDPSEDSERGGRPNPAAIVPEDEPDLVERMKGMVRSGRIDNDAFAGEPQMDDEDDALGDTEDEE